MCADPIDPFSHTKVMTREEEITGMIREVLREFRAKLRGCRVILFGSRARGEANPRSDFDVGVIGPGCLSLKTFYEIEDELEELDTLYRIDWVDLNRASPEFRRFALRDAVGLYG